MRGSKVTQADIVSFCIVAAHAHLLKLCVVAACASSAANSSTAVLCCDVLCCAALCCVVLCCAVLCCPYQGQQALQVETLGLATTYTVFTTTAEFQTVVAVWAACMCGKAYAEVCGRMQDCAVCFAAAPTSWQHSQQPGGLPGLCVPKQTRRIQCTDPVQQVRPVTITTQLCNLSSSLQRWCFCLLDKHRIIAVV